MAAGAGISGTVTVDVEVDNSGLVSLVRSIDGPKTLQPAAEYSAKRWRFGAASGPSDKRHVKLTFVFELVLGNQPAVDLTPSFFPPFRVDVKGTKPNFVQSIDSDPPMRRKPRAKSKPM